MCEHNTYKCHDPQTHPVDWVHIAFEVTRVLIRVQLGGHQVLYIHPCGRAKVLPRCGVVEEACSLQADVSVACCAARYGKGLSMRGIGHYILITTSRINLYDNLLTYIWHDLEFFWLWHTQCSTAMANIRSLISRKAGRPTAPSITCGLCPHLLTL